MKRTAFRRRQSELSIASSEAESALLRAYAADTCDERVSEDIYDVEDEYAEVAIIVHRVIHALH